MRKTSKGPQLQCRRIVLAEKAAWDTVMRAFDGCEGCGFQQAWLPRRDRRLRPTLVRVGWDGKSLLVLADLADDDPFNPVKAYNEFSYEHGDVFEVFLRPETQDAYFEFHITPANQNLQLRFPCAGALKEVRKKGIPPAWKLDPPLMQSRTRVLAEQKRWLALARIPVRLIGEQGPTRPGARWLFSFSRYDYTRGVANPVLSSSSPHAVCSYHRQKEWGTLVFA